MPAWRMAGQVARRCARPADHRRRPAPAAGRYRGGFPGRARPVRPRQLTSPYFGIYRNRAATARALIAAGQTTNENNTKKEQPLPRTGSPAAAMTADQPPTHIPPGKRLLTTAEY